MWNGTHVEAVGDILWSSIFKQREGVSCEYVGIVGDNAFEELQIWAELLPLLQQTAL